MRRAYIDWDILRIVDELFNITYKTWDWLFEVHDSIDVSKLKETQVPLWFYNMGEND